MSIAIPENTHFAVQLFLGQIHSRKELKTLTTKRHDQLVSEVLAFHEAVEASFSEEEKHLIYVAFDKARLAHYNQNRKDEVTPYFVHPIRVATNVIHFILGKGLLNYENPLPVGAFAPVVAAALLHDTIEDTNTTYRDIEHRLEAHKLPKDMIDETISLVFWLTDIDPSDGSRAIRKRLSSERIARAPLLAQIVKLADIYDNIQTSGSLRPEFFELFVVEKLHTIDKIIRATDCEQLVYLAKRIAFQISLTYVDRTGDYITEVPETLREVVV